jgi:hypothetical protein
VINDVRLKVDLPPFRIVLMLSQFMAQKSYLICIQINHVLNKTYTQLQHKHQQIFSQSSVMISQTEIEIDGGVFWNIETLPTA